MTSEAVMGTRGWAHDARGFSLIETLIATMVLAIGMMGAASAFVAATKLDRRFSARAAAHQIAMDLARDIERWDFTDPRLAYVNRYTGAAFAEPTVDTFSVTRSTVPGTPSTVTETWTYPPDHDERECGFCGRDLTVTNATEPGRTYAFRRYWNVTADPANPHLKVVAVHVTYSHSSTDRGVATVFTSVLDQEALVRVALNEGL